MLVHPPKDKEKALGKVDMRDLDSDSLVQLQHRYYIPTALFMAFGFPCLVAGLCWNDWVGGFLWAGVVRLVFVHHATFCVNSLAHYLGDQTYDDIRSPRDHFFTALVTLGEGYHNFHHEYPNDHRNAIRWYQYDPTKWLIQFCSWFKLTHHLKQFPQNEIQKGAYLMQEKKLKQWHSRLNWGIPLAELPSWSLNRFQKELKLNPFMIIIENLVLDVSLFIHDHPGGVNFIRTYLGKDATEAFNGGVYKHATAARNLTASLRVARIADSNPKQVWQSEKEE
jgi:stearoyl-CoA desaturase (delta-9 desaturase)